MRKHLKKIMSLGLIILAVCFVNLGTVISVVSGASGTGIDSPGNYVLLLGSNRYITQGKEHFIVNDSYSAVPFIKEGKTYVPTAFAEEVLNIDADSLFQIQDNEVGYVGLREAAEKAQKQIYFNNGLIVLYDNGTFELERNAEMLENYRNRLAGLPSLGTKEYYEKFLLEFYDQHYNSYDDRLDILEDMAVMESADMGFSAGGDMAKNTSVSEKYSETNVQVEGVDEGDIIKTDGEFIYCVSENYESAGSIISIVKAYPAKEMKLISQVLTDISIQEIFIDEDIIVLVSNGYKNLWDKSVNYGSPVTIFKVYDISDKEKPELKRDLEVEGSYNSARRIGDYLYFNANAYCNTYVLEDTIKVPSYTDLLRSNTPTEIGFDRIYYFPETKIEHFIITGAIDLKNHSKAPEIDYYGGYSNNLYVSSSNMYITTNTYNYNAQPGRVSSYVKTNIYKFHLEQGKVTFAAKASVNGSELNQFSMDEYKGYFRMAVTDRLSNGLSVNNLYVFDADMKKTGEIIGAAPDEQIYSVRFMEDKGYMVTFKLTDPLFAMDLSDPKDPKIAGELKIPGYSNYLHPYDEDHLIGFGKDSFEKDGIAYDGGIKISLFDISDMNNPKEKFTEIIGGRGSYSEVDYNHKAFLFSREDQLLAFPAEIYENEKDYYAYGNYVYQGAFVYNVDPEKGFQLKGKISHMGDKDYYDYTKFVTRIIYIGEDLYTVSNGMIKAVNMHTMEETGSVKIK